MQILQRLENRLVALFTSVQEEVLGIVSTSTKTMLGIIFHELNASFFVVVQNVINYIKKSFKLRADFFWNKSFDLSLRIKHETSHLWRKKQFKMLKWVSTSSRMAPSSGYGTVMRRRGHMTRACSQEKSGFWFFRNMPDSYDPPRLQRNTVQTPLEFYLHDTHGKLKQSPCNVLPLPAVSRCHFNWHSTPVRHKERAWFFPGMIITFSNLYQQIKSWEYISFKTSSYDRSLKVRHLFWGAKTNQNYDFWSNCGVHMTLPATFSISVIIH